MPPETLKSTPKKEAIMRHPSCAHKGFLARRAVTLVELLLVIALISMCAGFVGVQIHKAVKEQEFLAEAKAVLEHIRLAQDLMLSCGAEIKAHFVKGERGVSLQLESIDELPKNVLPIFRKPLLLKRIKTVSFEEMQDEVTLHFMSQGTRMPRGRLLLSSETHLRFIHFFGYPKEVVLSEDKKELVQEPDIESIYQLTQREIHAGP